MTHMWIVFMYVCTHMDIMPEPLCPNTHVCGVYAVYLYCVYVHAWNHICTHMHIYRVDYMPVSLYMCFYICMRTCDGLCDTRHVFLSVHMCRFYMSTSVYVCACIYLCILAYRLYDSIYANISVWTHACGLHGTISVHVCEVHVSICVQACLYFHSAMACISCLLCPHVYTCLFIYMQNCMHIFPYIYIHTCVCMCIPWGTPVCLMSVALCAAMWLHVCLYVCLCLCVHTHGASTVVDRVQLFSGATSWGRASSFFLWIPLSLQPHSSSLFPLRLKTEQIDMILPKPAWKTFSLLQLLGPSGLGISGMERNYKHFFQVWVWVVCQPDSPAPLSLHPPMGIQGMVLVAAAPLPWEARPLRRTRLSTGKDKPRSLVHKPCLGRGCLQVQTDSGHSSKPDI